MNKFIQITEIIYIDDFLEGDREVLINLSSVKCIIQSDYKDDESNSLIMFNDGTEIEAYENIPMIFDKITKIYPI